MRNYEIALSLCAVPVMRCDMAMFFIPTHLQLPALSASYSLHHRQFE
jgi:hypothetical protein